MENTNQAQLMKIGDELIIKMKELQSSKDWKKVEDKPIPISKFQINDRVAIYAKITLKLPFQTILEFFSSPYYGRALSDMIKKCDVLYSNETIRVVNSIIAIPGPISNREMVVVNTVRVEGNKAYIGNRSCKYPFNKHPDTVMIQVHASGYILEKVDSNTTIVAYLSDEDVKGSIPGFLKNIMVTKRPAILLSLQKKIKQYKK